MSSFHGLFNILTKKKNKFTVGGNHEYKKTDMINSVQSSHPLWAGVSLCLISLICNDLLIHFKANFFLKKYFMKSNISIKK